MIKIIVIDDDIDMQQRVRKIIRKVLIKYDNDVKICNYTKFDKNLELEINNNDTHKIYLLDIELENDQSGIHIAQMIRDKDWDSQIIFMTNHDKMFETVYRSVYQVFDFIEKFHYFEKRLTSDIEKIMSMKFDNKMFIYVSRNIDLQIYYKSILYIYRDTSERKVFIVTDQNKFAINLNIHEMLNKLDNRFKLVHRACIVNKDRVQKFDWNNKSFSLDNGDIIPLLSKKFKKELENND